MLLPKYTNYHSLTVPVDHIYAVTDKNLYKWLDAMNNDRSQKDGKKNCAFNKDIGHNTETWVALKDEIERLIKAGHFKEFLDEPQAVTREDRLRQWSPERIREVLTIIGGPRVARESHNARDRYVKEAKTPPKIHVHRT